MIKLYNKFIKSNDEKSKVVLKNAFFSFFIKGLNITFGFLTIPLVLSFLNTTQYGIWLTLTTIVGWFSLFDLGFGNGLRNQLTTSITKNNFVDGKIYVSTTYAALSVIFGSLIIIFLMLHQFINWVKVFNAPAYMAHDLNFAVLFSVCFLFIQFIVRLVNTVLLSFQRAAMVDFLNCLIQFFTLFGLFLVKFFGYNSLKSVAFIYSLIPVAVYLVLSLILFYTTYSQVRPSISFIKANYVRKLLKIGTNFFLIQIAGLVLYASDNFIIAQLFVPSQVTVYNISFKYFSITNILLGIILAPFWSMTTKAYLEGDWNWMKSSIRKLQYLWLFLIFTGVLQLVLATFIYGLWTNHKIVVPFRLSAMLLLYFITFNWSAIYSNFLNGVGKIRLQLYWSIACMIVNIPLAIILVKYFHVGLIGIPLATTITVGITNIICVTQYYKIVNFKASGVWDL